MVRRTAAVIVAAGLLPALSACSGGGSGTAGSSRSSHPSTASAHSTAPSTASAPSARLHIVPAERGFRYCSSTRGPQVVARSFTVTGGKVTISGVSLAGASVTARFAYSPIRKNRYDSGLVTAQSGIVGKEARALNWARRRPLAKAKLAPGKYMLFTIVSSRWNGQTTKDVTLSYADAQGHKATTTTPTNLTVKKHC